MQSVRYLKPFQTVDSNRLLTKKTAYALRPLPVNPFLSRLSDNCNNTVANNIFFNNSRFKKNQIK